MLSPDTLVSRAAQACQRAVNHLLALQDGEGWWKGELETNVTMDAEDLFLREFLGVRTEADTTGTANWIRSQQRADGTWANFYGGPANLSTSVEAYAALRLAGDPGDADHMLKAARFIRDAGGIERSRVFTRIWMALLGLWRWEDLPVLPPEMIFLPRWFPLNIYDFACWARQTIVALTVLSAHRPSAEVDLDLAELRTGARPPELDPGREGFFHRLDRWLHRYERKPIAPLRRLALRRAERWIVDRQEADGSWGGIQPPWVYSMMALHTLGRPLSDPVMVQGFAGLARFTIKEGDLRRLEACQSPVWDTCLAVIALSDAGISSDHPAMVSAGRWLLDNEVTARGDWAVRRPRLEPGGWAFEFANANYPDIDDTSEVVMALRRLSLPEPQRVEEAVQRGISWSLGMQSSNGAWAAFDVDNDNTLCTRLPFCDFGAVIDPPSADVTAHMVEMLAGEELSHREALDRAVTWLLDTQESDGSWFGRWGANYVYGLGAAIPALAAAGIGSSHPAVRAGVSWLEEHQNADGGWGEDLRSYDDPAWHGRGESTASQTAWALLALLAAGERSTVVEEGVAWLIEHQRDDGGWDEPWFTGTGFPGDFYINYHLYRIVFPVMALGRYVNEGGPG